MDSVDNCGPWVLLCQDMFDLEVIISTEDGLGVVKTTIPLLLPHELFSELHKHPEAWHRAILGRSSMRPEEFWRRVKDAPYMQGHPLIGSDPSLDALCLPFGVHGDGAQFTKLDSFVGITWNCLLGGGRGALETRFLVTVIPEAWLLPGTLNEILHVVAWSLGACTDGVFPSTDHMQRAWPTGRRRNNGGTLLANGWRGIVVDFRGDWSWHKGLWDIRAWSSLEMCHSCRATLDEVLPWADFGEQAGWRLAPRRTTEEYLAEHRAVSRCRLCLVPGWHLSMIKWDVMHTVNMGIARLLGASGLLDLVARGLFGPGPLALQLKVSWSRFLSWCREHRIVCNARRFTPSRLNVKRRDWPELSSKAWNTRVIVGWLSAVACQDLWLFMFNMCIHDNDIWWDTHPWSKPHIAHRQPTGTPLTTPVW